jgi:hypothetical protein
VAWLFLNNVTLAAVVAKTVVRGAAAAAAKRVHTLQKLQAMDNTGKSHDPKLAHTKRAWRGKEEKE